MRHIYTFRKQINSKGYYVEFDFDVQLDDTAENNLSIEYLAGKEWEIPCRAGIMLFFDYLARQKGGALKVTVYEIRWLPVDTNNLIVLYGIVKALNEVLGLEVDKLGFDAANETFIFPETRSFFGS